MSKEQLSSSTTDPIEFLRGFPLLFVDANDIGFQTISKLVSALRTVQECKPVGPYVGRETKHLYWLAPYALPEIITALQNVNHGARTLQDLQDQFDKVQKREENITYGIIKGSETRKKNLTWENHEVLDYGMDVITTPVGIMECPGANFVQFNLDILNHKNQELKVVAYVLWEGKDGKVTESPKQVFTSKHDKKQLARIAIPKRLQNFGLIIEVEDITSGQTETHILLESDFKSLNF